MDMPRYCDFCSCSMTNEDKCGGCNKGMYDCDCGPNCRSYVLEAGAAFVVEDTSEAKRTVTSEQE